MSVPDLRISHMLYIIESPQFAESKKKTETENLLKLIKEENMSSLWNYLHNERGELNIPFNKEEYSVMNDKNQETLADLETVIAEAEEADGEMEVAQGWRKVGEFLAKIGDKDKAIENLKKAIDLAPGVGSKIDNIFTIIRIGMVFNDLQLISTELETVNGLIERGGDWERRNRFKVYKGLYSITLRNFDEAAKLLLDCLSTFTMQDVLPYEEVVQYATLAAAISLDRVDLKTKVIDSPEILAAVPNSVELEIISSMVNSLYLCDYATFFKSLADVEEKVITQNRSLAPNSGYYCREMRRKAYSQLLESYQALSLRSMSHAFGVSEEFLESDLGKFIPTKQLNCVIDKVNGIVLTNRPDNKNAQYHNLLKQGDILLTKLQKYGNAVRLSSDERID